MITPTDPYAEHKKLTFEQREGLAPMPSQLASRQISQEFRAVLWALFKRIFEASRDHTPSGTIIMGRPWNLMLQDAHVYHHQTDDFPFHYHEVVQQVKSLVTKDSWSDVLGWLEYLLKHPACPRHFAQKLDEHMTYCRLAYRVIDGVIIHPVGSDAERQTIEQAFGDVAAAQLGAVHAHLRKAAQELTAGKYADSVRESIHAVEATARVLVPGAKSVNSASDLLGSKGKVKIHANLKHGFQNLYGFTSDERGIRHPLIDDDKANVDETRRAIHDWRVCCIRLLPNQ
jgi:hypothetical protein